MTKKKFFNKIAYKINLIYILIFFSTLLLIDYFIIYGTNNYLKKQIKLKINTKAIDLIGEFTKNSSHYSTKDELKNKFSQTIEDSFLNINNMSINIYNSSGDTFIGNTPFDISLNLKDDFNLIKKYKYENKNFYHKTFKIRSNRLEEWYIQLIYDTKSETEFINIIKLIVYLSTFIGIIVMSLIGMFSINNFLKPIYIATNFIKDIKFTNLNKRINFKNKKDEFSILLSAFNEMLDRIENSFLQQSRFVSDASHELRTPISVIKGYISLLDRWGKNDQEVLQESIDHIKEEISNMGNLIEKLLFLARGESQNIKVCNDFFYINDFIEEVIQDTKIISSKPIQYTSTEDCQIYADKKFFKQMLRALIDNSIKYTDENGKITIEIIILNNQFKIKVKDNGIGIHKKNIPHLFDRFYRADENRSKDTGGSGIGLSVVKWIVELYKGTIEVDSDLGVGSCFTLVFPKDIFNSPTNNI